MKCIPKLCLSNKKKLIVYKRKKKSLILNVIVFGSEKYTSNYTLTFPVVLTVHRVKFTRMEMDLKRSIVCLTEVWLCAAIYLEWHGERM